jgi:putative transposase
MQLELTDHLGREPYERVEGESNHRNGSYERRFTLKNIGEVKVDVPRDRNGEYSTKVLPRSKRYEDCIREDLSLMFLTGINTRTLSMISKKLIGRRVSAQEVSNANHHLIEAVEQWRNRDLSEEAIKYLFVDGVNFRMRVGNSIELVPVLVVIGVTITGHKLVLGFQAGDKESSTSWREFFKDLKRRGLRGENITLGIMDGLPGLEKVFKEEFFKAKVQRCQVHVARNVLAKVPRKFREEVADDIRSVFYASTKDKATEFFNEFKKKWIKDLPSATKCFENSIASCLTFFNFPQEEWSALRTTNIIERVNKEYKRRTKSMEIVAGEKACYTLLAFISLKMELHWRTNPIGKVRKNLPFFENYKIDNFTQKN